MKFQMVMDMIEDRRALPDRRGHFGQFGGPFVAGTLVHAVDELREAYGFQLAAGMRPDQRVLINLSGRSDRDVQTVAQVEGLSL